MDNELNNKIENLVSKNKIFLFMKGTPEMPLCGFSAQVVHILNGLDIEFDSFNVFDSLEIREGIKEYSNWPTIPQLYVNKEFIGGCDIVVELFESGELQKILEK